MGFRYWSLLDYAKPGIDQFRIRPEYGPESLEPVITGDLCIVTTISAETLQGGSSLAFLGLRKSWDRTVSIRPEYEPESLEPLISGDLGIVRTKSATVPCKHVSILRHLRVKI